MNSLLGSRTARPDRVITVRPRDGRREACRYASSTGASPLAAMKLLADVCQTSDLIVQPRQPNQSSESGQLYRSRNASRTTVVITWNRTGLRSTE